MRASQVVRLAIAATAVQLTAAFATAPKSNIIAAAETIVERACPSSDYNNRLLIGRKAQLGEQMIYRSGMEIDSAKTYGEFDLGFFATAVSRALEGVREGATFVDVGSGCGRLVFAATSLWPRESGVIARYAGVEYVPELHELALQGAARLEMSSAEIEFYCADAADMLSAGGPLESADLLFSYSSSFACEGDELSDYSATCGTCLRVGTRIVTTDKRLVSVDGLWAFQLLERLEGPNAGTGGTSVAYVYEVVQSKRTRTR
jgi:SAM-dependent methyltransferase